MDPKAAIGPIVAVTLGVIAVIIGILSNRDLNRDRVRANHPTITDYHCSQGIKMYVVTYPRGYHYWYPELKQNGDTIPCKEEE